jgi:hypothetical protein
VIATIGHYVSIGHLKLIAWPTGLCKPISGFFLTQKSGEIAPLGPTLLGADQRLYDPEACCQGAGSDENVPLDDIDRG